MTRCTCGTAVSISSSIWEPGACSGQARSGTRIAVEVKSFASASSLSDFHMAVGQFLNYRIVLDQHEPERKLYLAVTEYGYDTLLSMTFGQLAVANHRLTLIVFDERQETIKRWLHLTNNEES